MNSSPYLWEGVCSLLTSSPGAFSKCSSIRLLLLSVN